MDPQVSAENLQTPPAHGDGAGAGLPRRMPAVMFNAALTWLLATGGLLHLHEGADGRLPFLACVAAVVMLWPLFIVEAVGLIARQAPNARSARWCGLLPGLRLGLRDSATAEHIWLPRLGWQRVDQTLQKRLEQALNGPMLAVSLAVLPLVVAEYVWAETLAESPRLHLAANLATSLIWWAFTTEFVLMLSVTDKKLAYVKEHWLDLAIILLPLIAFLRALRLGRLLRLQQMAGKTARVYKLRGVLMKMYRAVLVFKAVRQLLQGPPEKRLVKLRAKVAEQEAALEALRTEICELEAQLTASPTPATASIEATA